MITVTSVRTNIAIDVIDGGVFDPDEAAILKLAYDRAVAALSREYHLTEKTRAKLAKTVLRIGRMSLAAGRSLTNDQDVHNIASAASVHLVSIGVEATSLFSVATTALFKTMPGHGLEAKDHETETSVPDIGIRSVRGA